MTGAIHELRNAPGGCERTLAARRSLISRCGREMDSSDFAPGHLFLSDVFFLKRHDAILAWVAFDSPFEWSLGA